MSWFEDVTGFSEDGYAATKARLSVDDGRLVCQGGASDRRVGSFSMPSLSMLRAMAADASRPGRLRLSIAQGDVRSMHRRPENAGALFQVASQFNMLEMPGPGVVPESGVEGYMYDRTQGPACAIAAGAATIFRNYLVPVGDGFGQTADRQLDGLADLGVELAERLGTNVAALWTMRNGYAFPTPNGLDAIAHHLRSADEDDLDELRGLIRYGLQTDVEVTDVPSPGPLVSQIFCSALPIAYSNLNGPSWEPFARLVLEAAYEATLLAGVLSEGSNRILLTRIGGGVFGNDDDWIDRSIGRALRLAEDRGLDVAVVSYSEPTSKLTRFVRESGYAVA